MLKMTEALDGLEAGAAEREFSQKRPYDVVERLRSGGFLTLRVPQENNQENNQENGDASLRDTFAALIDVARADSNVAQALRAHFAYVEGLRFTPDSPARTAALADRRRGR